MIKNCIVDHIYRVINRQRLFVINQIHANPERRSTAQKNFAEVKARGNPNRGASSDVIIITEEFAKRLGLYQFGQTLRSGDQTLAHCVDFPCEK
ncbi:unnamed protein product [Rhizophagus irregularis]|nr:unnamed protein product [Rhizophagus irregularis]